MFTLKFWACFGGFKTACATHEQPAPWCPASAMSARADSSRTRVLVSEKGCEEEKVREQRGRGVEGEAGGEEGGEKVKERKKKARERKRERERERERKQARERERKTQRTRERARDQESKRKPTRGRERKRQRERAWR